MVMSGRASSSAKDVFTLKKKKEVGDQKKTTTKRFGLNLKGVREIHQLLKHPNTNALTAYDMV